MGISVRTTRLGKADKKRVSAAGLRHRSAGLTVGTLGWMAAMVAFVISIITAMEVATGASTSRIAELDVLSFGIAIAALGTGKTGIALVLRGIVRRIIDRVASIKEALPALAATRKADQSPPAVGVVQTSFGKIRLSVKAPRPLFVHQLARIMWLPILLMGLMALYGGLVVALAASGTSDASLVRSLKAWVQGLQFLGEGFLLSAISFILGTILATIRRGGGEVQESLGTTVKTLLMPLTAKIFLGLMMLGLMIEVVQFGFYVYVASLNDAASIATYSSWLGPFREFGLGVLLSGVVLALATIAKALDFQFSRIRELIINGR